MYKRQAPEKGRKLGTDKFYTALQTVVSSTEKGHVIIRGDFNTRIGKIATQNMTGARGEIVITRMEGGCGILLCPIS